MGMWLYSFCDILNYIFTQIFIIDIQKIMIMTIRRISITFVALLFATISFGQVKSIDERIGLRL